MSSSNINLNDGEFITSQACLRATVDNAPLYSVGDIITATYVLDASTDPATVRSISYQNLSNGTFPIPFFSQNNGVDVIGVQPNAVDFTDCETDPAVAALSDDVEAGCLFDSSTGTSRPVKVVDSGNAVAYEETNGTPIVLTAQQTVTMGECPTAPIDREKICYVTDATGTAIQTGWARHDDNLVGVVAPNVDPAGIAYFTATNPVQPLSLATPGLAFVNCESTQWIEDLCHEVPQPDTEIDRPVANTSDLYAFTGAAEQEGANLLFGAGGNFTGGTATSTFTVVPSIEYTSDWVTQNVGGYASSIAQIRVVITDGETNLVNEVMLFDSSGTWTFTPATDTITVTFTDESAGNLSARNIRYIPSDFVTATVTVPTPPIVTPFQRVYTQAADDGAITTTDLDYDGQPYDATTEGTVTKCKTDVEVGCLKDEAGNKRNISIVYNVSGSAGGSTQYIEANGDIYALQPGEEVTSGQCECPVDICYQVFCKEPTGPEYREIVDGLERNFDTVETVNTGNSPGYNPINSIQGGNVPLNGAAGQTIPGDPDWEGLYVFDNPRDNVYAIKTYNNNGANLRDGDGIGNGCTTVTLIDSQGDELWEGTLLVATNTAVNGQRIQLLPETFDDVAEMRFKGICWAGSQSPKAWRQITVLQRFEAELTWTCGQAEVTATIDGPAVSRLSYSEGILDQVNGPHTMVFNGPGAFNGRIITDNPGAFSTLLVENGTVVTVNGADGATFSVEDWFIQDVKSSIRSGIKNCGVDPDDFEIRDSVTGEVVEDALQVSCVRDNPCQDHNVIGEACYVDVETTNDSIPIDYDDATSAFVSDDQGVGTVRATVANNSSAIIANYPGPYTSIEFEYFQGTGTTQLGLGISTAETGLIDMSGVQWQPPTHNSSQVRTNNYIQDNVNSSGITVDFQEINGKNWFPWSGDGKVYFQETEGRVRITFSEPITDFQLIGFSQTELGTTEHIKVFSNVINRTARYRKVSVIKDCSDNVTYLDTRTGSVLEESDITIVPCPDSSTTNACITRSDGSSIGVIALSTYDKLGNYFVRYYTTEGARRFLNPGDVVSLGPCLSAEAGLPATVNEDPARETITGPSTGSITAGFQSISFLGITGTSTVAGQPLLAGEVVEWTGYFDPTTNEFKRLGVVAYSVPAGAVLRINGLA